MRLREREGKSTFLSALKLRNKFVEERVRSVTFVNCSMSLTSVVTGFLQIVVDSVSVYPAAMCLDLMNMLLILFFM